MKCCRNCFIIFSVAARRRVFRTEKIIFDTLICLFSRFFESFSRSVSRVRIKTADTILPHPRLHQFLRTTGFESGSDSGSRSCFRSGSSALLYTTYFCFKSCQFFKMSLKLGSAYVPFCEPKIPLLS